MLRRPVFRVILCILLLFAALAALLPLSPFAAAAAVSEEAEAPRSVILLEGGDSITWTCGIPFTDPGFTAYDAKGRDRTGAVKVKGEVIPWKTGTYELSYRLKDRDKTIARAKRTVRVVKAELPDAVKAPKKTIYLTFDDGPGPYTEKVLKILDKYNIKATFFIVGSRSRCAKVLPKIAAAGHTIGIHAYNHNMERLYQSKRSYFSDLMQAQEVVHRYTGSYASVARLPGGSITASFMIGQLSDRYKTFEKMMHKMGLRYYDWDIQPESAYETADGTYRSFVNEMRHRSKPTIVLQHDTRYYSVKALENMIQWALDHGYSFLPIDQTTPEVHFIYQFPG